MEVVLSRAREDSLKESMSIKSINSPVSRSIIFPGDNNSQGIHDAAHNFANQMRLHFER